MKGSLEEWRLRSRTAACSGVRSSEIKPSYPAKGKNELDISVIVYILPGRLDAGYEASPEQVLLLAGVV